MAVSSAYNQEGLPWDQKEKLALQAILKIMDGKIECKLAEIYKAREAEEKQRIFFLNSH